MKKGIGIAFLVLGCVAFIGLINSYLNSRDDIEGALVAFLVQTSIGTILLISAKKDNERKIKQQIEYKKRIQLKEVKENEELEQKFKKVDELNENIEELNNINVLEVNDFKEIIIENEKKIIEKGGESQLLTRAFMAYEIVLDNEYVYWMPFTGEGMPPAPIFAVSKKGGEALKLTDPRPTANGLCVDDAYLYWVQTDGIYRQSKKSATPEKIYTTPANEITSDLKMDAENFYFLQGKSKRNLIKLSKKGGDAALISKEPSQFWIGKNEIIIMRYVGFTDTAIFKISKDGTGEKKLDSGYVSDLIIHQNKVYVSDMVKIYELNL